MIDYPNNLNIIFDKLNKNYIKPIIVGGYIRDKLLNIDSKDIDIELYGVDSLDSVEEILSQFGSVSNVGKSFGVCKLLFETYDLDFSLPRKDNKIGLGHKGFKISTDKSLDFKTASSRRDFTINSMGFDIEKNIILDPFHGKNDLDLKLLRAVDIKKFGEDPLRILRGIQFSVRFNLKFDEILFEKCKSMINNRVLNELPKERIFDEFKKLLLKSKKPSKGLLLLKQLGAFSFFTELKQLQENQFQNILLTLDVLAKENIQDEQKKLTFMLSALCREFSQEEIDSFLAKFTNENRLIKDIKKLLQLSKSTVLKKDYSSYDIYLLATKIEIETFLSFLSCFYLKKEEDEIQNLSKKAKKLNVYQSTLAPLLHGKDLIALGLKPSKKFSLILDKAYAAQMQNLFHTKEEAIVWLRKNLLS